MNCQEELFRIAVNLQRDKNIVETATFLSNNGADELFYCMADTSDVETIKTISCFVDIPIQVQMQPKRFEDVKKVLYAGATSVALITENAEVIKEVVGRFGSDKIRMYLDEDSFNAENIKLYMAYGITTIVLAPEINSSLIREIHNEYDVCIQSCMNRNVTEKQLVEYLIETKVEGCIFTDIKPDQINVMKHSLINQGFSINVFETAIPFSEFKLNSDSMIPVVVQDYKTNEVLMVAYMNEEAYGKTIETGRMTYYSRSRESLWVKGETSGHFQYVKSLQLDCDNDTILAKVAQIGVACHTGSRSCFFKQLVKKEYNDENPLTILQEDYQVIAERKNKPKEGSYTNYLFDKGIDKILKKVGEEATEIVIAAKNPDSEELKYEISDFLYHVMVLMVERGLTWEDITKELVERR